MIPIVKKLKKSLFFPSLIRSFLILCFILTGCIGEDFILDEIPPEIRLTNPISSLEIASDYQFEYMFTNNVGEAIVPDEISWTSSDPTILTINTTGLATGKSLGTVLITLMATYDESDIRHDFTIEVAEETIVSATDRFGTLASTSSYLLRGDFTLSQNGTDLLLDLESNYAADTGLPGLYVYLSNNPNSTASAFEIGSVTQFSGAHSYTIPDIGLFDYEYVLYFCKPFNARVGSGKIMNN